MNLTAGTTNSQRLAWDAYTTRLAKSCPEKHLDMLAPGELIDTVDEFTDSLPSNQKKIVKASIGRSCRGVDMGASCGNTGFLQAAVKLRQLDHFVTKVCALHERCNNYSDCVETE
ncbi:MAG TPA: hypothetical protein VF865_22315 [Acidobacteriaceae bacterium]